MQQGSADLEEGLEGSSSKHRQSRNTICSSSGSPFINRSDHNSSQDNNRMELRVKLELMQKLQTELLQMIENAPEDETTDGLNSKSLNDENNLALLHSNTHNNDDAIKQLLEEHSNLLKKTLILSARRKSFGSKIPSRGELALDLCGGKSPWPNSIQTDENDDSVFDYDTQASPRFGNSIGRSRNLSKENVPTSNGICSINTVIEGANDITKDVLDPDKSSGNHTSNAKHVDLSIVKGNFNVILHLCIILEH